MTSEQQLLNDARAAMQEAQKVMKEGMAVITELGAERDAIQARLDALVAAAEAVTAGTEERADTYGEGGYWWSAVGMRADDLSSAIEAAKGVRS